MITKSTIYNNKINSFDFYIKAIAKKVMQYL